MPWGVQCALGSLLDEEGTEEQGGTVQSWWWTHCAWVRVPVCCAALLSLGNKASVHYHIYRLVLKRLLLCQRRGAVWRRDHRKSNQLSGKWNGMRVAVCYRKDTTRCSRRGRGRWSNISWPVKSEIYYDLNSWPASVWVGAGKSHSVSLHNLKEDHCRRGLNAETNTFIFLILFLRFYTFSA